MKEDSVPSPWACVLDPVNRVSLAVVRSLGRAGLSVRLGEPDLAGVGTPSKGPAAVSRYVKARVRLPSPLERAAFAEKLLAATRPGEVILPVSINSLLAVLSSEALRRDRRVPFGSLEEVRRANAKPSLLARAASLGLSVPRTLCPRTLEEGLDLARAISYPCVLKLADDEGLFLPPEARYSVVGDPIAYRIRYRQLHERKPCPIVQEYVTGEGWGVALLYWKGRRLAHFIHRRLREYPRAGGPASLAESVHDPELLAAACRLLEGIHWEGPAMVEFRRAPSGRPFLMEINPRFWGTLSLSIACGVDFPLLLYRLACGEPARGPERYPAGVRLRIVSLEWARVWDEVRGGEFLQAARESWTFISDGRVRDALFDREDPAPTRAAWVSLFSSARIRSRRGTRFPGRLSEAAS